MKKFVYILSVLFITILAACSANEGENATNENSTEQKEQQSESVNVDKGLLNVEVTVPSTFFDGEDIDTIVAEAENEGIKVTKNENGSLTYKMSKSEHKEMMKEMGTSITDSVEEIKNSEDFVSIHDITYNKSYSEFTLVVDRSSFENSLDGFAALSLGLQGSIYQIFNGEDPNNYKVTILLKDEGTEEVFDEIIFPDAFEEMEE